MEQADILIIGAGAIGCATARQAAYDFPDKRIVVLEKNFTVGLEASGRNSGVIHSGFHHPAGSLKEKLANQGGKMAKEYAQTHNIPLLKCGMLVVFPRFNSLFKEIPSNIGIFKNLYLNSLNQKIKFSVLSKKGVKKIEPNVEALGGIFMPEIAVIDFECFVKALYREASDLGVEFCFNVAVEKIEVKDDVFLVNDRFRTYTIFNCAGIYSDEISLMCGINNGRQYPVRGEYYRLANSKSNIVSRLVCPAVPPGSSSKGILFSPRTDGSLFVGPSFKLLTDKSDYENNKTPAEVFIDSVRSFMPDLNLDDLTWGYSGIRAKVGLEKHSDFIIKKVRTNPDLINNIGIDSPGLSSSLAIAQMNCRLLKNP